MVLETGRGALEIRPKFTELLSNLSASSICPLHNRLTVGLLGSFTTFPTFGYETMELVRTGDMRGAGLNAGLSLALGLGAVVLEDASVRALAR